jgi:hypothetical protein
MIAIQPAMAWGDEGHKVIALIAQALLNPIAKQRVNALLDADSDSLTAHDIASEATWADKYREANIDGSRDRMSRCTLLGSVSISVHLATLQSEKSVEKTGQIWSGSLISELRIFLRGYSSNSAVFSWG